MHATRCRVQEREGVAGDEQKIEVKGLQHEVGPQTCFFPARFSVLLLRSGALGQGPSPARAGRLCCGRYI